jgi:hypothetical protein
MKREINLSGGEITLLKTLGLSGNPMSGSQLIERMGKAAGAEFLEDLSGMMMLGYVLSSKVNIANLEDVGRSTFRVNASYARDLRDAISPNKSREDTSRRQRRRG